MTARRAELFLKIGGSVIAAGILAALFILGRSGEPPAGEDAAGPEAPADRLRTTALVDRQIDSVLALFNVAPATVRKRSHGVPGEDFARTERLVSLPDTVAAVSVNAALNDLARRNGGRAVASENLRLGTVTIHVEIGGAVVHTVILKKVPRKPPPGGRQTRPAT